MPSQVSMQIRQPTIDWANAQHYAWQLAQNILASDFTPTTMLVVARGGLCVAGLLFKYLEVPKIEVIRCRSYDKENKQGTLYVHQQEQAKLERLNLDSLGSTGEPVLIVDDIYDTGATINFIRQRVPRSKAACLVSKMHKGRLAAECDFYGAWVPPVWVSFPWEGKEG